MSSSQNTDGADRHFGTGRVKTRKALTRLSKGLLKTGRDGEIRTRDLTHPKRARYQAAPRPVELVGRIELPSMSFADSRLATWLHQQIGQGGEI